MAYAMKIALLTDELITVLTGVSPESDSSKFNLHHESALRILCSNNYARTNQFDILHQFEGLDEKLRVYNKEDLADSLRQRVDELTRQSHKWTPEILHLLLELSDKPVFKSDVDSLDFLEPTVELTEPRYKWEELAAEDPLLRDKNVWRNIDYTIDSSDDEVLSVNSDLDASNVTEITTTSSLESEFLSRSADSLIVHAKLIDLHGLETAQFWRLKCETKTTDITQKVVISELQAIREVLFMLSGVPTVLFTNREQDTKSSGVTGSLVHCKSSRLSSDSHTRDIACNLITPVPRYVLNHASPQVFHGIMTQLAQYGDSLLMLRNWTRRTQDFPLLQSLQFEVMEQIRRFDDMISKMQARYVEPGKDVVISLLEMKSIVMPMVRPLLHVSDIISVLDSEPYAHGFHFLELLYDRTCESQIIGDDELYEYLGTLFFNCFKVYLRQIRRWMEEGELTKNDHIFFVSEDTGDMELASLWSNRYRLRQTSTGKPHVPRFLHPATDKIFTTGKSVVVLKTLKKYDRRDWPSSVEEPALSFRTVCGFSSMSLNSFPELFDVAFEQWVKSKHHVPSSMLRKCLFDECGLQDSLAALESIYFMVDGATMSHFAGVLFNKLDSGKRNWNDRFTLTELARDTIGSSPFVKTEKLRATFSMINRANEKQLRKSVKALTCFTLTYSLPWLEQIIVTKESIPSYQKIFSFLLQIRRSICMLQGLRIAQISTENALFYGVRSQLLWFASTLYSHLTDLVIDPNIKQMHDALRGAEDVDQMIDSHRGYIKKLIDQSLLGSKLGPIYEAIITILDLSFQLMDIRKVEVAVQAEKQSLVASVHDKPLGQSLPAKLRHRQQGLQRIRLAHLSEDDDSGSEVDSSTLSAADRGLPYFDELREIRSQFNSLCKFVATGLSGVARAGREPTWDILADKLESGLGVAI